MSEEQEVMEPEAPEVNPIEMFIDDIMSKNYSAAQTAFGDMIGQRMTDALDAEKVNLAQQVYNGAEPDEEQLELDLDDDDDVGAEDVDADHPDADPDWEDGSETFTASGFDTPEAFEQKFNEGRKAALAKVKEASGAARQFLAEGTNAMQETFKVLGSIVQNPPKPEAPAGIITDAKKKTIKDPVTGIVINTSQMEAISGQLAGKTKQINASVDSFFNRLGHPLTEDQKLGNFPAGSSSDGVFSDGDDSEADDPFKDAPETTPEEFNKNMKSIGLPIRFTGGGFGIK